MIDEKLLIKELSRNSIFEKVTVGEETVYDIINRLPKVGEWIPCSERLPKPLDYVIVTTVNGTVEYGYKLRSDDWDLWSGCVFGSEIIAWMPLPQPYGEKVE